NGGERLVTSEPGASRKRLHLVSSIAFVAVLIVAAFIAFAFRDRIGGNPSHLLTGDCFDLAETGTVEAVQHHVCTDAHLAEVVEVLAYPASSVAGYPAPV